MRCEGGEHLPAVDHVTLNGRDPVETFDRVFNLVGLNCRDDEVRLVEDQLEPELHRLMNDDEKHLVGLVRDRDLRGEKLLDLEMPRIGQALVPLDRLALDLGFKGLDAILDKFSDSHWLLRTLGGLGRVVRSAERISVCPAWAGPSASAARAP